jgi:hypothetical protein
MKKIFFLLLISLLSCQGPWDYYPEDPPVHKGIWTQAYIVAGEPVKDICFDKLHALDEVRMPNFAFYESAQVEIFGTFNGEETTLTLTPRDDNKNCFMGQNNTPPQAGKTYELSATFTWDSSGQMTTSNYTAKTKIPERLKIEKAYDISDKLFEENATIQYLKPVSEMQSLYFIPEYSDDVGGVFVSMILPNTSEISWGENYFDYLMALIGMEQDDEEEVIGNHARFGEREILRVATAQQFSNAKKEIDSIQIAAMNFPAKGTVDILFYGTTTEYIKYRQSFLLGSGDSRIRPIYNIENGAGIFAGMVPDTFTVKFEPASDVKLYPYKEAQDAYCKEEYHTDHLECLGYQDLEDSVPYESDEWCFIKDFPIYSNPACGSAMVRFSKQPGIKSSILTREVKKWCAENPEDKEC